MFTLANNCKLMIFFGVIFIINLLAFSIRIINNNNVFIFKLIAVQLQLYIPYTTDSFYIYKKSGIIK